MLIKRTADRRLVLPAAALKSAARATYFDVVEEAGRIVLTPVDPTDADRIRADLAGAGVTEADLDDAIDWARGTVPPETASKPR